MTNVAPGGDHFRESDEMHRIDRERGESAFVGDGEKNTLKSTLFVQEPLRAGLTAAGNRWRSGSAGQEAGAVTLRAEGKAREELKSGDGRGGGGGGTPLGIALEGEMNTVKCTSFSSASRRAGGAPAEGIDIAAADSLATGDVS